ncbi:uncharacterized protein NP_2360A [Natronomonas pharaonis DSM 2160]|uniref:Uncharacterized protein n=1 Tax=Natronomonas pharaonis (strain ATCC 35678 / DSM 2160 / CIP 103997 / JCM 8858 / NBRC 14720 / NCIMB 2260 / Gabara) TaxID=348780 RepID=A0A1U7EW46_NATPD|nr:hypothetical protein [Natronomonas pharaonis]CAI49271.1 uncharacterized protein NP_2360A [Natronomonas pharaonis DSM 2160]
MTSTTLYLFQKDPASTPEIARREVLWLLKDQADSGWGLTLAGVEEHPPTLQGAAGFLGHNDISEAHANDVEVAIDDFRGEEPCYLAPFNDDIDAEYLASRLADTSRVAKIPSMNDPDNVRPVSNTNGFWETSQLPDFFDGAERASGASFNIAHPYQAGPVLDVSDMSEYTVDSSGFNHTPISDGPLFTVLVHFGEDVDATLDQLITENILNRVPPGSSRISPRHHCEADPDYAMDEVQVQGELDIQTSATCGGSILARVSEQSTTDAEINKIVARLDKWGFSIAGEYVSGSERFILFKMHPRHSDLDDIGPGFDPSHERRKLNHSEWARETLPGYRQGVAGDRQTVIDEFDGWRVLVEKPGRKDAEDFIGLIEGPEGEQLEFDIDQAPFEEIFSEVKRNALCESSGREFMQALYRLYRAEDRGTDLRDAIVELADDLPPHSNPDELRYSNRRAFLWLLALVFIVEDVNYRFNFHPIERGGPQYRKQGRDQPMNAILKVLAEINKTEEELAEQSRSGELPERLDRYDVPDHLQDWFDEHIEQCGGGAEDSPHSELSDFGS